MDLLTLMLPLGLVMLIELKPIFFYQFVLFLFCIGRFHTVPGNNVGYILMHMKPFFEAFTDERHGIERTAD